VPAFTVRLFSPSASKGCAGVPPFTWNEKSFASFVPPLSLVTTFFTINVPVALVPGGPQPDAASRRATLRLVVVPGDEWRTKGVIPILQRCEERSIR
jgi:hypothetical protein